MDYTIRNVKIEDLDKVTEVEALCFPTAEAAVEASFRQRIETFPDSFFVAEDENGSVTDERTIRDEMFEDSGLHRPEGLYQSVFGLDVIPEFRRQGVAADLMNRLMQEAKARGKKGMILTCKDRLIHYYEKFGYRNLGLSASVHGGAVWYDMLLEF